MAGLVLAMVNSKNVTQRRGHRSSNLQGGSRNSPDEIRRGSAQTRSCRTGVTRPFLHRLSRPDMLGQDARLCGPCQTTCYTLNSGLRMIAELWRVMHSWWPLLLCKAIANGFHPTTLTSCLLRFTSPPPFLSSSFSFWVLKFPLSFITGVEELVHLWCGGGRSSSVEERGSAVVQVVLEVRVIEERVLEERVRRRAKLGEDLPFLLEDAFEAPDDDDDEEENADVHDIQEDVDGFRGGPRDGSLLTHYVQHVAYAISQGRIANEGINEYSPTRRGQRHVRGRCSTSN
ncbi:hypothetical protein LR48_Vigan05g119400 [Vigna angularis]|uniref:Uncharacterized protein n=1 Tax=Phaseolus angularis TaxID=3914 RepID=A0A0L9UM25_PHAAN|nr:hypothetical protein LR48_Vigan05g119400 [Vigna angularis]